MPTAITKVSSTGKVRPPTKRKDSSANGGKPTQTSNDKATTLHSFNEHFPKSKKGSLQIKKESNKNITYISRDSKSVKSNSKNVKDNRDKHREERSGVSDMPPRSPSPYFAGSLPLGQKAPSDSSCSSHMALLINRLASLSYKKRSGIKRKFKELFSDDDIGPPYKILQPLESPIKRKLSGAEEKTSKSGNLKIKIDVRKTELSVVRTRKKIGGDVSHTSIGTSAKLYGGSSREKVMGKASHEAALRKDGQPLKRKTSHDAELSAGTKDENTKRSQESKIKQSFKSATHKDKDRQDCQDKKHRDQERSATKKPKGEAVDKPTDGDDSRDKVRKEHSISRISSSKEWENKRHKETSKKLKTIKRRISDLNVTKLELGSNNKTLGNITGKVAKVGSQADTATFPEVLHLNADSKERINLLSKTSDILWNSETTPCDNSNAIKQVLSPSTPGKTKLTNKQTLPGTVGLLSAVKEECHTSVLSSPKLCPYPKYCSPGELVDNGHNIVTRDLHADRSKLVADTQNVLQDLVRKSAEISTEEYISCSFNTGSPLPVQSSVSNDAEYMRTVNDEFTERMPEEVTQTSPCTMIITSRYQCEQGLISTASSTSSKLSHMLNVMLDDQSRYLKFIAVEIINIRINELRSKEDPSQAGSNLRKYHDKLALRKARIRPLLNKFSTFYTIEQLIGHLFKKFNIKKVFERSELRKCLEEYYEMIYDDGQVFNRKYDEIFKSTPAVLSQSASKQKYHDQGLEPVVAEDEAMLERDEQLQSSRSSVEQRAMLLTARASQKQQGIQDPSLHRGDNICHLPTRTWAHDGSSSVQRPQQRTPTNNETQLVTSQTECISSHSNPWLSRPVDSRPEHTLLPPPTINQARQSATVPGRYNLSTAQNTQRWNGNITVEPEPENSILPQDNVPNFVNYYAPANVGTLKEQPQLNINMPTLTNQPYGSNQHHQYNDVGMGQQSTAQSYSQPTPNVNYLTTQQQQHNGTSSVAIHSQQAFPTDAGDLNAMYTNITQQFHYDGSQFLNQNTTPNNASSHCSNNLANQTKLDQRFVSGTTTWHVPVLPSSGPNAPYSNTSTCLQGTSLLPVLERIFDEKSSSIHERFWENQSIERAFGTDHQSLPTHVSAENRALIISAAQSADNRVFNIDSTPAVSIPVNSNVSQQGLGDFSEEHDALNPSASQPSSTDRIRSVGHERFTRNEVNQIDSVIASRAENVPPMPAGIPIPKGFIPISPSTSTHNQLISNSLPSEETLHVKIKKEPEAERYQNFVLLAELMERQVENNMILTSLSNQKQSDIYGDAEVNIVSSECEMMTHLIKTENQMLVPCGHQLKGDKVSEPSCLISSSDQRDGYLITDQRRVRYQNQNLSERTDQGTVSSEATSDGGFVTSQPCDVPHSDLGSPSVLGDRGGEPPMQPLAMERRLLLKDELHIQLAEAVEELLLLQSENDSNTEITKKFDNPCVPENQPLNYIHSSANQDESRSGLPDFGGELVVVKHEVVDIDYTEGVSKAAEPQPSREIIDKSSMGLKTMSIETELGVPFVVIPPLNLSPSGEFSVTSEQGTPTSTIKQELSIQTLQQHQLHIDIKVTLPADNSNIIGKLDSVNQIVQDPVRKGQETDVHQETAQHLHTVLHRREGADLNLDARETENCRKKMTPTRSEMYGAISKEWEAQIPLYVLDDNDEDSQIMVVDLTDDSHIAFEKDGATMLKMTQDLGTDGGFYEAENPTASEDLDVELLCEIRGRSTRTISLDSGFGASSPLQEAASWDDISCD